jgi:hypothetical protein
MRGSKREPANKPSRVLGLPGNRVRRNHDLIVNERKIGGMGGTTEAWRGELLTFQQATVHRVPHELGSGGEPQLGEDV